MITYAAGTTSFALREDQALIDAGITIYYRIERLRDEKSSVNCLNAANAMTELLVVTDLLSGVAWSIDPYRYSQISKDWQLSGDMDDQRFCLNDQICCRAIQSPGSGFWLVRTRMDDELIQEQVVYTNQYDYLLVSWIEEVSDIDVSPLTSERYADLDYAITYTSVDIDQIRGDLGAKIISDTELEWGRRIIAEDGGGDIDYTIVLIELNQSWIDSLREPFQLSFYHQNWSAIVPQPTSTLSSPTNFVLVYPTVGLFVQDAHVGIYSKTSWGTRIAEEPANPLAVELRTQLNKLQIDESLANELVLMVEESGICVGKSQLFYAPCDGSTDGAFIQMEYGRDYWTIAYSDGLNFEMCYIGCAGAEYESSRNEDIETMILEVTRIQTENQLCPFLYPSDKR